MKAHYDAFKNSTDGLVNDSLTAIDFSFILQCPTPDKVSNQRAWCFQCLVNPPFPKLLMDGETGSSCVGTVPVVFP